MVKIQSKRKLIPAALLINWSALFIVARMCHDLSVKSQQRKMFRKSTIATAALSLMLLPSCAWGYGSKTYESVDQLFDRPYISNVSASAYLCIPAQPTVATSSISSVNSKGDKVNEETIPETQMPLLYEQVSGKWLVASQNSAYNTVGNPCTKGQQSIWFNDINFIVPTNNSASLSKMLVVLATPVTKIITTTKHHQFLWRYSTTTKTSFGGATTITSGSVNVYRTGRDATDALVGTNTQFFSDINYISKENVYTNWFPYNFDPGP